MSKSGPSVFAVIGDTDWWSSQNRHVEVHYDSRLRNLRRLAGGTAAAPSTYPSIVSAGTRNPVVGQRLYFEGALATGTNGADAIGLVGDSQVAALLASYTGGPSSSVAYYQGAIYKGGVAVQTGLTIAGADVRIGWEVYRTASGLFAQLWIGGVAQGTAVALSDEAYRIAGTVYYDTNIASLFVDRDDLLHLPVAAQPWGAAARAADAGGYSPAASVIAEYDASLTADAYLRTISGASLGGQSATIGAAAKSSSDSALYYVEFDWEQSNVGGLGNYLLVGLRRRTESTGSFPGASADGWGFSSDNSGIGQKYTAGAGTTVASSHYTNTDNPGALWQPSTGNVWFTKNGVPIEGDPEAGTGASFTGATGDVVPAMTPYNGRVRVCTHAREQRYRPSYAQAWDGADILPEQHYRDAIVGDTEITTGIWFPFPWGGSRRTGSPLGTVVLDNASGDYDNLRWYDLRDEELVIYELVNDRPEYFARVMCDSVFMDGESTVSIASRGLDCLLDVRIDAPAFTLGVCDGLVPLTPISSTQLIWNISHTPYFAITSLLDGGVAGTYATQWVYAPNATAYGVRRLTSASTRQAVDEAQTFRPSTQVTVPNGDFALWTGDNPNSWTVTESAGTAEIKQNGSAARFLRTSGTATCTMTCTIAPPATLSGDKLFAVITVSDYVSGDILVGLGGVSTVEVGVNGTGTFTVPLSGSPRTTLELKCSSALTDLTVTQIDVWHCTRTDRLEEGHSYLLTEYAGLSASQYEFKNVPSSHKSLDIGAGYWTDQRPTVRQIIEELNHSWVCDYYTKPDGVICFVVLSNPGDQATTATLIERDAIGPVISVRDDLAPALTDRAWTAFNFLRYQDNELAGAVTDVVRSQYTATGVQDVVSSSGLGNAYHGFYAHAVGAPPRETILNILSATVLSNTLVPMYEDRKIFFEREYKISAVREIEPGDYVSLTANRYGISAKKFVMVSKTRRLKSSLVRCVLWG